MKLLLFTFAVATVEGSVHASEQDTVFHATEGPKCFLHNGRTIVHYEQRHDSFKCTHTSATTCACTWKHPTHHDPGGCQEFDHVDTLGRTSTHTINGDCTDSGLNFIDGGWSSWTYGTCSKSCGTGTQSMTRTCDNPAPFNGGAECTDDGSSATSSRNCNTHACPVDCVVPAFSAWSTCTVSCGGGSQQRSRATVEPQSGGVACPHSAETRACNSAACAVDCVVGTFPAVWSTCSKSCGIGGFQSRTRTHTAPANGGKACPHTAETQVCTHGDCPVHCATSAFSAWTSCTKSCATGTQQRTRSVTTSTQHGGYVCPYLAETRNCNSNACPVNGVWSGWSYGTCSKSCGTGTQSMTRTCNGRANGGADCAGSTTSSQSCNTHACPVNGVWSGWSYGTCSADCGTGTQSMTRTCNSPSPAHGGANCAGSASSSQSCNTHACPVNGGWSGWSGWGGCSQTCNGGTQSRSRSCNSPAPANGGADCAGSSTESTSCNTQNCGSCNGFGGYERTCNENNWHSSISFDSSNACQFHVNTGGYNCHDYCNWQGSSCLAAQDNYSGCSLDSDHTRQSTSDDGCNQEWGDQVCVCAKK